SGSAAPPSTATSWWSSEACLRPATYHEVMTAIEEIVDVERAVLDAARAAREAQPALARLPRGRKDAVLLAMAEALVDRAEEVVAANARDLEAADEAGIAAGLRDRLKLDADRMAAIAQQLRDAAALPDPV